nr:helix-turn-helix transcriptional regulator [Sedimentibacter sp.]
MLKFANNLKLLRNKNGLKQKQIADLLDITERQYQRYEAGTVDPPTSKLVKLSNYFNVSLDYLTGRTDEPINPNVCTGVKPWTQEQQ